MNPTTRMVTAAGAGAVAILTRRLIVANHGRDRSQRWPAVTVHRSPDEIGPVDSLPDPLRSLGSDIEVRIRPAAGDKGTELLAMPTNERVSTGDVRSALRQAKSLLETGMVLSADSPPSTHPGPAGRLLRILVRRANKEGRL
jgi:hypothetical protein